MANHKSAIKRIRQTETKKLRNRIQHKTTRNAIKQLKDTDNKKDAEIKFHYVLHCLLCLFTIFIVSYQSSRFEIWRRRKCNEQWHAVQFSQVGGIEGKRRRREYNNYYDYY